jgi:DNA polymerase-3 subunit gamma/tau
MILNSRELIFGENNTVTIKLENQILVDRFNQVKTDLGEFIRKRLGNVSFKMEAILLEKEEKKSLYTASDKYQYLVSKNPLLEDLKVKLGLDLDY